MLGYSVGRRDRSTRNGDLRSEEVTSAREGPVRGDHLKVTMPMGEAITLDGPDGRE